MTGMPTEPYRMTAAEAASLIAERALSAEELTASCLARISERNDAVKAWAFLDPELALQKARELDKTLIHNGAKGPLHGLPFGIKDMIDTGDMPTTNNSPIYQGHRPAQDAQIVRNIVATGGFALGKTDTVEFASGGRKALTRHPMDPTRTPGGSSSGSGAAVGDFQVPLALGTQTGGSHIRPASFNGIYGIKPTHNAVAWPGARQFCPSLDTLGWYGRSPDDLILVARAFRLWHMEALPAVSVKGLKVGIARTSNWDKAAPETHAAIERAAGLMAEEGAEVFDLDLPEGFERVTDAQATVSAFEGMIHFLPEYLQNHHLLHGDFRNRVENVSGVSPESYLAAVDLAAACRAKLDALFGDRLDVILTPSAPGEAPVGPHATTGDAIMNRMWTLLHAPCVNIPGATGPNGLPVGVTLAGPRHGDARLLAISKAVAPVIDPTLRG
jgi:Asp-tRNA(Asn)/Glu-tRNA(Gln) amidotransferase A subunit family amidase